MSIFRVQDIKSVSRHINSNEKNMSALDLTLLSVGSVIGTGVMVLTGIIAAKEAGPGVMLSFLIGGIVASIIVLCYGELCSAVPSSGGSYTFAYVALGELFAYIVGLSISVAYVLSTATVGAGWSAYFVSFLSELGINFPKALSNIPGDGGIVNLPAIIAILLITFVISIGTRESKKVNNIIVLIKVGVIAIFIFIGVFHISSSNWIPFLPYKITGVLSGAAAVFYAYCGFDSIASAAPYVKNPKKSLTIGLLASLGICILVYIAVSAVLTGLTSYKNLDVADALSYGLTIVGKPKIALIVSLGSVIGILAVIFANNFTTSQILATMSRDGLLPKIFGRNNKKDVPIVALWIIGILEAIFAGFFNMKLLASFSSIAFLLVYGTVSFSVIFFRRRYPNLKREFSTPLFPIIPILGTASCLFLMANLPKITWIIFAIILVFILITYFVYGKNNSKIKELQ
ncbi:APC family permease [Clostridium thermobutyricum]|uniref:APC family permease n=1 Tax=Clostridium thermobutyricum TaxID=29372 RepID=UPI0025898360|nr:amino acid permease [Clostridium thermobutyricum]